MKKALITGITGQDGTYLSELLLRKGYEVHGVNRRQLSANIAQNDTRCIAASSSNIHLHYGDLTDSMNITSIIQKVAPDEIYNLGAMSRVKVSFEMPEHAANADAIGMLRILEAVRLLGLQKKTRIYQASSSELYGKALETPQSETTPFYPRSPYAVAKLYAYWIAVNYREAYGMYACNGILFNHESPLRGEMFVSRKITLGISAIITGQQECLYMGNLNAKRDWGHAKDYVEAMWLILQQPEPEDFVIATGETTSIRDFIKIGFDVLGIKIEFRGEDENEIGYIKACSNPNYQLPIDKAVIKVDPAYYRPTEVDMMQGNSTKARQKLNWTPKYNVRQLAEEMVLADIRFKLNMTDNKKSHFAG
ncbi:hypothetical protein CHS0354_018511 [Potamilus streckersoni]|uniref:GDP-mannose 4,6-dehydratase n=1 Tax=Potamilus streckersoni TaxID=2493646 RepID=A0AAE0WB30_9BIVA|nr:hypothetical protein CHS0354_018511 [Potamilus streckersoni]